MLTTPLPGENLRAFYERSREYWAGTAYAKTGSRGKILRREGFGQSPSYLLPTAHNDWCKAAAGATWLTHPPSTGLASAKYEEYKPILEEIERIQKEAELDKEAIGASKRTAMGAGEGRHRR